MKLGYNPTLKQAKLEDELIFCEKYGFDAVELRIEKIRDYLSRNRIEDLEDFFQGAKLKPLSLNAIEGVLFADKTKWKKIRKDLDFLCDIGDRLNIQDIVIVPSFHQTQYSLNDIRKEAVHVLQQLGNELLQRGKRLAFEFVGNPNACVNTFGQCYEIVMEVNLENVGISLDFFHFYAMNSSLEDLKNADIEKIFLVHMNDADFYPPGSLREELDRLFPGDGAIPIQSYMDILQQKHYQGLVSVELFREEYYGWEVEHFIRTVKEKASRYIS
jgi:2-keto-myo-inositol isomerase